MKSSKKETEIQKQNEENESNQLNVQNLSKKALHYYY
jgi:hypothetical protein